MLTAASPEAMNEATAGPDTRHAPPVGGDGLLAFPASVAQQVFWYLEMLQPGVSAFNVAMRSRLEGPLDARLLERSLNVIAVRHEILRTRFEEDGGELLQVIEPVLELELRMIDLTRLPEQERQAEADRLGRLEAGRPFALGNGPLIRAGLVKLEENSHILHVTAHHAVFDGSSIAVMNAELAAIYQALRDGREIPLVPLPIQYGDYSVWQKDFLEGPAIAEQLAYWKKRLAGMTELELPADHPRAAAKSWRGDLVSAPLPRDLMDRLQAIATRNGGTLYHLLLAAFKVLLHRYTGRSDITVGSPAAGRTRAEMEPLIGVFINSLVLRDDLAGDPSFECLIRAVRDTVLEALGNQDLPFGQLVRELRPDRDASRNPLFQVNFTHQRSFSRPTRLGPVEMIPLPSFSPGAIFDLNLFTAERADGWSVTCDYSSDLFDRSTARRMLGHFQRLLEDIAADPARPISKLEILTAEERQTLLHQWAGRRGDYPRDATLGELFREIALASPDRVALESGDRTLSYGQLHAEAAAIAGQLLAGGLEPGEPVGLCARPSFEMIAGLLGILLAGGAYVPLDPDYPAGRLALLLEESGIRLALTTPADWQAFGDWDGRLVGIPNCGIATTVTELPPVAATAIHPACLLFTSGSTGKPKGVLVPHRGVVRLVRDNGFLGIAPDEVFLQAAPLSFDASTFEIWGPLLNGGRLVIPEPGSSLDAIASAVRNKGVTTLWLTAGLFQVMIDEHAASLKGLRHLLAGGDVLPVPQVRRALELLPGTTLFNGYGPTENTTFTTCHRIVPADGGRRSIPIGRPVLNTAVVILDDLGRLVPAGVPGELHAGGDGLALGYHGDAALTAEKFIVHPQFGRLYRTGDLCRWLADGSIEFIGRRDQQAKVRGFRIEPGEIEAVLAGHPEVRQSKVAVRGDSPGGKRILAWVTTGPGSALDGPALAAWLAGRLPGFMRPDAVAVIGNFPVTANGKIDLAALPDPAEFRPAAGGSFSAPRGDTEQRLAALWSELLGIPEIGRDDDFFELGGHSLVALRMFSRIHREFGGNLPLAELLAHPTVARLAGLLARDKQSPRVPECGKGHLVTLDAAGSGPPLFCIHGGDGGVLFYRNLAGRLPHDGPLHAIESRALGHGGPIPEASVEETAAAYVREVLAVHPGGPFRLAGYSFGGVVAHEMACQLAEQGHTVDFLGLFDTQNPATPGKPYSLPGRLGTFWQQQQDLPLPARLERLRERIAEGIATHRRVKDEVAAAMTGGPAEAHSDLRRVQLREENWRAMQAYRPSPFPGRVTLFKAMTASDKVEWPEDYGWAGLAGEGLEIVAVPGQHLTLFDDGNVGALAKALGAALPAGGTAD
jgi:amino acid adenylation domain-containing protein